MKTKVKLVLSLAIVLLMAGLFEACSSKSDPVVVIDKTALTAAITAATTLQTASVEGKAAGQYPAGSKAILQTAIDAANTVATNTKSTQTDVSNAVTSLAAAVAAFQAKVIAEVDPTNLVAYWKFDEGTGTTVGDLSGSARAGTLTAGHPTLGGGIPTWTSDRKGTANKALHFTKGGHIEVPSNAAFNPAAELSISVWVYLDSLNTQACAAYGGRCAGGVCKDNYIVSQNSYNGYKFQTQDDKYPFFTYKKGEGAYTDVAANTNLKLKNWYHVVVAMKAASVKFYINGADVSKSDAITGGLVNLTDRWDFVIGQETPNAKTANDITYVLPHMEGSLDDIRIYKVALTPTQVTSIYTMEKP